MRSKYQIFVSSTFTDLKVERDLVIKAILEMGHIPVGMEMFSAGDEEQWKLIKKQIDDCDYYVVIAAFRYGSMDGEISYTEKEYDYATQIGVPTLGFIIDDTVSWPADKVDKEASKVNKLNDFKSKIKRKIVGFWTTKEDLYGKVSISLMKQFATNPRAGWVRANEYTGPEVLSEISRLSKENSDLRNDLYVIKAERKEEELEKTRKTIEVLKHNQRRISFFYQYGIQWENSSTFSLFDIFNAVAPELMIENSTKGCARIIGITKNPDSSRKLRMPWEIPSNTVKKILADLAVLDLIEPSTKKHKVSDENEYWTMTAFGKVIFKEVRKEVLEKNLQIDFEKDEDEKEK